ncbi:MAG: FAD-dependent oxidoreductase, partial [Alphaproteobacteria bacterium]|nr:FAD-dependent oxidoreductase [Alphaproteobacteria bacterium]
MMGPLTPDLCVIGAGAAGLSVAAGAAQMGAEVVLIERGLMGGDCLNFGCVPSKSLLAAARLADLGRRGAALRVASTPSRVDFAAAMDGVQKVIATLAPKDSVERFERLGVRVVQAEARFTSPRTIHAGATEIRPRRFIIATGSHPAIPEIPGLDRIAYLTNETVFANRELPEHLIIVGGGPIGIEMAQAHCRLGSRVTVLDNGPVLPRDDPEVVAMLLERLAAEGIAIRPRIDIAAVDRGDAGIMVRLADGERIVGSHLLVAAGRRPSIEALDLPAAGITATGSGITVDARLRTTNRRAFAIGDVAGGPQFTHIALYQAGIVIRNALFRLPAKVDYRALPWTTYTDPELAQVGLTEPAARAADRDVRVTRWPFVDNDRAQTERDIEGIVKVVLRRGGRVVGASILGAGAGDLIVPWALAISQNLKIGALANLVVPYPTRSEASKRAAACYYTP